MEIIGRLKGPLKIRCFACSHAVIWTPAEAIQRLGGACSVPRARRRLRCSACGARKVEFDSGSGVSLRG